MAESLQKLIELFEDDEPRALRYGFLAAVAIRCILSTFPYSGETHAPMYGDFEAQRHWMEITTGLPVLEWYEQGPQNDLQYWGLDYPPLTAFHSWLLGKLGQLAVPECFALVQSHGYESQACRAFMRSTVILSDLFVYFPGCLLAVWGFSQQAERPSLRALAVLVLWLLPPLLVIDHGHFQFNGVCFGLCLAAAGLVAKGRRLAASVLFTSGLLFKQIALYYAPGFFFGILAVCIRESSGFSGFIANVATTGLVVLSTVALLFSPWLLLSETPLSSSLQVLHRMFPFARGLYEDKVANVWCTISVVFKLNRVVSASKIPLVCASTTFLALLPSNLCCLRPPRGSEDVAPTFAAALLTSSFAFFLFGFQVHEKSVLFPYMASFLLPLALGPRRRPLWLASLYCNFTIVCLFSMYPLLMKDHLHVPYTVGILFLAYLFEQLPAPPPLLQLSCRFVVFVGTAIHLLHALLPPPLKYPDAWILLFTGFSCCYFVAVFLLVSALQIVGWHHLDRGEGAAAKSKKS